MRAWLMSTTTTVTSGHLKAIMAIVGPWVFVFGVEASWSGRWSE